MEKEKFLSYLRERINDLEARKAHDDNDEVKLFFDHRIIELESLYFDISVMD